ncbi:MAG: response regulator, partial [Desulfobacteraceae bacterium]|nr:response regulator [Desulfobacteraceae bacterium]
IGTLAGGIAHDFNNILSGMLAYSQLTKMHIKDFNKADSNIDQVIKGIRRAADLVQQILIFSRQTECEKRSLKISLVVKEALKLIRVSIPSTIRIEENISTNSWVMADPTQIHQVVMNLCTNAYHSMQKTGGALTVKLKEIILSKHDSLQGWNILPGNYVRLDIKDTGQGMDPYTLNKIFEPYFTTKPKGKGTGLGLAMVYNLIKEQGGDIVLQSEEGKGACFEIYLPKIVDKQLAEVLPEEEKIYSGSGRILIVDDDEVIRLVASNMLKRCGYEVTLANDGQIALDFLESSEKGFDLMILDLIMPNKNGYETFMSMKEKGYNMPVIVATGFKDDSLAQEIGRQGAQIIMQKPFTIGQLSKAVYEVLHAEN